MVRPLFGFLTQVRGLLSHDPDLSSIKTEGMIKKASNEVCDFSKIVTSYKGVYLQDYNRCVHEFEATTPTDCFVVLTRIGKGCEWIFLFIYFSLPELLMLYYGTCHVLRL